MPMPLTRIGRRVRFRDIEMFFAVVECSSMAKAAAQLARCRAYDLRTRAAEARCGRARRAEARPARYLVPRRSEGRRGARRLARVVHGSAVGNGARVLP